MTSIDPETIADPAARAAWHLLAAHEDATTNGYREADYPEDQMNELAQAMHAARGITGTICNAHTRARDLWTARALLAPLRAIDNAIWRIEVLETNCRRSYCGSWVQDASITGPPSDNETDMLNRAQELVAAGHVVQIVCEQPTRSIVWQSRIPWSASRIGQIADDIAAGRWKLDTGAADPSLLTARQTDLLDGNVWTAAPPDANSGFHRRAALAALEARASGAQLTLDPPVADGNPFLDGQRVWHARRDQWGTVDGSNHGSSTWVRFDGEPDAVEVSNELLRLTKPVPR